MKNLLRAVGAMVALAVVIVGCSSASSDDSEQSAAESDLVQAHDLFHPTGAPMFTVPATVPRVNAWEVYATSRGATVIGRGDSKKVKAVLVQLYGSKADGASKALTMRAAGYVLAPDVHFDPSNKSNEMRLLSAAVKQDVDAWTSTPAPATEGDGATGGDEATDAGSSEEPDASAPNVSAPPKQVADAGPPPPSDTCGRNWTKTVLYGLDLLKDGAVVAGASFTCPETVITCVAGVVAFTHAVYLASHLDDLTCTH
jgi:hypothetical protein